MCQDEIILTIIPELLKQIPEHIKILDMSSHGIELTNRSKDRWLSIITIINLLSSKSKHMTAVINAAKKDLQLKNLEEMMSPENIAFDVLADHIKENTLIEHSSTEYIALKAKEVSEAIIKSDIQRYFRDQGQVTRFLKGNGIIVERRRVSGDPTIIYKMPLRLKKFIQNLKRSSYEKK